MALKTNSKALREKIRALILNTAGYYYLSIPETSDFNTVSNAIMKDFHRVINARDIQIYRTWENAFIHWMQGLPGACKAAELIYLDEYYRVVDFAGDLLEQSPAERAKYTQEQAADLITKLIYRELLNNSDYNY